MIGTSVGTAGVRDLRRGQSYPCRGDAPISRVLHRTCQRHREENVSSAEFDQGAVPRGADTNVFDDEQVGFGWLFFAGTVLGLAGLMRIVDSLWAFSYGGSLPENLKDSVLGDNLTTYAWVWLGVGILLIVSSFLLLTRSQFARWVGLIASAIMGVSAMTWMPYYPIWALTYVAIALLAFYGLAAHAGRTPG